MRVFVLLTTLLLCAPARAGGIAYEALAGEGFSAHVFRIELARAVVAIEDAGAQRRPIRDIVAGGGELLAVNASFFDTRDRAMGVVAGRGRPIAHWGALVVSGGQARIVEGKALSAEERAAALAQGTPRLLVAGAVPKLKRQVARRTAVCAEAGTLIVVVTSPVEATALATWLRDRLKCTSALNLDGGASTQLEARLPGVELSVAGQAVPNALTVRARR